MRVIVGIDPGKLSGLVVVQIDDNQSVELLAFNELEQQELCSMVEELLIAYYEGEVEIKPEIVMEDFIITMETAKKKDTRYSLEVIGCIRYLANRDGIKFTLQTPVDAKTFSTDERLKSLGFYLRGGKGHHRDAMRHVVLYLVRSGWKPKGLLSE